MATVQLERMFAAAEAHGHASEPDHEVGDLQAVLESCWRRLTPEQRSEVYLEHEDLITEWLGEHST